MAGYHSRRQARKHAFIGKTRRRDRNEPEAEADLTWSGEPLKYPSTHVPSLTLPNGWTPPPDSPPDLPFMVRAHTPPCLPVVTRPHAHADTHTPTHTSIHTPAHSE